MDYLRTNGIELAGTLLSFIYLYLSVKQKAGLWIFGFLCSVLYAVVFFQSGIYALMGIQFYYMVVSVYGWISWKKGKTETGDAFLIRSTSLKHGLGLGLFSIGLFILFYFVLKSLTDSAVPVTDAFTAALSITATWMLARKRIEHWLIWIVVDSISVGLYIYLSLYPTAILFAVYTIMAVVGYLQWKKDMQKQV